MKDIEILFTGSREISIGIHKIEIKQISFGQLPLILSLIEKIVGEVKGDNKQAAKQIITALSKDFDSVTTLLAEFTSLSIDEIKKLNLAAAVKIITAIVEDNIDFLLQHVLPQVSGVVEKLTKKTGSMKSSDLSAMDTKKKK